VWDIETRLKTTTAWVEKFPNKASYAAVVAELTDEFAAARPKHTLQASELHLAVENLEAEISKAKEEIRKKAEFIDKLQQQGAEIYEAVLAKEAKIEELKLEITAANEAAIPPPPKEIPPPTLETAPALLASLRQTLFQNENSAALKAETRNLFTEFAANFGQVELMFRKMVDLHMAATADIHHAALASGTVLPVPAELLSPDQAAGATNANANTGANVNPLLDPGAPLPPLLTAGVSGAGIALFPHTAGPTTTDASNSGQTMQVDTATKRKVDETEDAAQMAIFVSIAEGKRAKVAAKAKGEGKWNGNTTGKANGDPDGDDDMAD